MGQEESAKRIAVFCVGNRLHLDDGVGPAVYDEVLERFDIPDGVELFDLGVLTMDMITYIDTCDVVITVDAMEYSGEEPGTVLRGSVTRLERFSECPYRHFLQYGLGLEERDEMSWEAADHGTFFHKVMEVILRSVKESGKRLKDLSSEEREELVRKGIGAAVRAGSDTELQDKADREYLLGRWKDLFARQIGAMAEMEADDGFLPESFELQFGGDELALDLGGGRSMRLSGQIDRLDVWKNAGTDWIRVVDYKTSDHSLDGTKLHAGLQLQLFTYLNVAVAKARAEGKNAMPGGLYYAVLTDKWTDKDLDDPEKQEQALNMCYRLTGLTAQEAKSVTLDAGFGQYGRMNVVRSSTLETVGAYVRGEEVRLGREILGGKITIAPAAEDDGARHTGQREALRPERHADAAGFAYCSKD